MGQATKGDYLIFYLATKGFFAVAEVKGPMRRPISKDDAPWAGGLYRYGVIIPFEILIELETPLKKTFSSMRVEGTSITASTLRRGFAPISSQDGRNLYNELVTLKSSVD